MKQKISVTMNRKLLKAVDGYIDGLVIKNRSQAVEHLIGRLLGKSKVAVILANGMVTRVTKKDYYRVLGKIDDETVIQKIVKNLRNNGFSSIFVIGENDLISEIFRLIGHGGEYGVEVRYLKEGDATGDHERIMMLKGMINSTFLALPGEHLADINLSDMWRFHEKNSGVMTVAVTRNARPRESSHIVMEGSRIVRFVEKPKKDVSDMFGAGFYVFEPEIFEYPGKWTPYDVTPELVKRGLVFGYVFSGHTFNINSKDMLVKAKKFLSDSKMK